MTDGESYQIVVKSYSDSGVDKTFSTASDIVQAKFKKKVKPGDINDDGYITLKDLILTLQVINNEDVETAQGAEVNDDDTIGMTEANYILESLQEK